MPSQTVATDPLRFISFATKEKIPTFGGLREALSSETNSEFVKIENGVGNFRVYLDRTFRIHGSSAYSKTVSPGRDGLSWSDPVSSAKPSYVWSVSMFLMGEDPYRSISAMVGKKDPELTDVIAFINGNRSSVMSFRFSDEPRLKWVAVISDEFGQKYEVLGEGDWAGYVRGKPLAEQNPDALRVLLRMMTVPQREDARMEDLKKSSPKVWKFYRKFVEEARMAGLPFHYPKTDSSSEYLRFQTDSYHVALSGSDKYGGLPVVDSVFQKGSRVESAISSMFRPVFKREFLQWNGGLAEKKVFDPGPDGGWGIEQAGLDIGGMSRYPDKW